MTRLSDEDYMQIALDQARDAAARDEVPVGAILVHRETGQIEAQDGNRCIELSDPSAHAETLVIREICKTYKTQRIPDFDLYVTLEPCTMCAAMIAFARIPRLIFGATDPKGGAVISGVKFFDQPTCHHKIEITSGVCADECSQILKDFFKQKRG